MYDFLIVGAGLFGAVCAHELTARGKSCLVIDKRPHIAGNVYTSEEQGINVHQYGAHIFHTSNQRVWDYVNQFADFNNFVNSPIAMFNGTAYNLPFNMNTFSKLWGIATPAEAKRILAEQTEPYKDIEPQNLEEQALKLVGPDVYETLVKGYTEKQWGRDCSELPAFIIRRLPVRFTYDNNYFNDRYQGIPMGGYTALVEKLLCGVSVRLETDYLKLRAEYQGSDAGLGLAKKVIYTGMIDEFFEFSLGELEYRSLRFEKELLETDNFQGNAAVNYTSGDIPYTRIIEHKHFEFGKQPVTIITREYPASWKRGDEPYYPINDARNGELYEKYAMLAKQHEDVIFGGRLGAYKYYDMDKVIAAALELTDELVNC